MKEDFETFLNRSRNYDGRELEYYEDTHDERGNYKGKPVDNQKEEATLNNVERFINQYYVGQQQVAQQEVRQAEPKNTEAKPISYTAPTPQNAQHISMRDNNMLLCTVSDYRTVEGFLDYLKRRMPAIVTIDAQSQPANAQRFLDLISGAAYALDATVTPLKDNQYLILPFGTDIVGESPDIKTEPIEQKPTKKGKR